MRVMREDAWDAAVLFVLVASYAIGWLAYGWTHLECYAPGFTAHVHWDLSVNCVRAR